MLLNMAHSDFFYTILLQLWSMFSSLQWLHQGLHEIRCHSTESDDEKVDLNLFLVSPKFSLPWFVGKITGGHAVSNGLFKPESFRFFCGLISWAPNQLALETNSGIWWASLPDLSRFWSYSGLKHPTIKVIKILFSKSLRWVANIVADMKQHIHLPDNCQTQCKAKHHM